MLVDNYGELWENKKSPSVMSWAIGGTKGYFEIIWAVFFASTQLTLYS